MPVPAPLADEVIEIHVASAAAVHVQPGKVEIVIGVPPPPVAGNDALDGEIV